FSQFTGGNPDMRLSDILLAWHAAGSPDPARYEIPTILAPPAQFAQPQMGQQLNPYVLPPALLAGPNQQPPMVGWQGQIQQQPPPNLQSPPFAQPPLPGQQPLTAAEIRAQQAES